MKAHLLALLSSFMLLITVQSCKKDKEVITDEGPSNAHESLTDWTTATHSNDASPDYQVVFNQNEVNRIDIVLTGEEYNTMRTNLADLAAKNSGGPGGTFSDENPVYVACDFFFNGIQWYNVGVRYKGNSSLYSPYNQNINKLPLRLKFDKFEDEFPEIKNQRFYGFKDLSLSSNFDDASCMREKLASDVFREFGVPAAQTAFYEVYVDEGNGPVYYGLYTMTEVVFDAMLNSQFGSESGNCYKPDGVGAQFSATGFDLMDFEKKTNEESADWSDVQELHNVLHSSKRTSDVEQWKTDLETVFDVDGFLKYLAVNNTIQNWDTYGNMSHNYYLYHDPADDLIKWIVWDNNEAFTSGKKSGALSFEMNEVNNDWPLISYLRDVVEYREIYDAHIADFIASAFEPGKINSQISSMNNLVATSANNEIMGYTFINGGNSFSGAVSDLKTHCEERVIKASDYLK